MAGVPEIPPTFTETEPLDVHDETGSVTTTVYVVLTNGVATGLGSVALLRVAAGLQR